MGEHVCIEPVHPFPEFPTYPLSTSVVPFPDPLPHLPGVKGGKGPGIIFIIPPVVFRVGEP